MVCKAIGGRDRLVLMPTTNYAAMLTQALEAGRKRDYRRAADPLARIVGSTDEFPQAQLYLGRAYHALGEFANAARVLSSYVRSRPASLSGQFFLGRAYLGMEEYGLAVRHLKKAVEQDPRFSPAYGLLGLACLKARRPDKAIWWFARALEVDPRNTRLQVGYLNTALVLAIRLYFRGELVDAARLFNEVLEQRRASILPHLYLASIYRELGKGSLALYHMDAASKISPQDPYLHLQKAVVLLAQGDKAAAADEIKAGTTLLKTSAAPGGTPAEILRFITVNLFREGRYREAIFYGGRLLRTAYNDPQMHALLAEAYRNLGELERRATITCVRSKATRSHSSFAMACLASCGKRVNTTHSCTRRPGFCNGTMPMARDTISTASPSPEQGPQSSRSWRSSRSRSRCAALSPC